MDVRQLALLARQPSARLQPREHFWGLPKRGLALILANALFWQPLWAQAGGVVVSGPGTTLGSAGNGVPIVNIAAPNAAGLSHNQYSDYNVGSNGLILNNANGSTQSTQLGGIIVGNPNLKGQAAASTIVNEVTGNNRSQLNGYTEVAGQAAHVIVANPYGITCNGCGFINTPRATLTTGKTVLDAAGRLDHYQVDGGDVAIEGAGINAGNVDSFEVITRSARINAQINANRLSVVAGRNDVDASSLQATPRADDGSAKPTLAIDSTALGGMYAGAIKLVGTEAGVGVKVAGNLAASAGDIQLDANGHLEVAQAAASGAVRITAQSVTTQGPVYAGSQLAVTTRGDLANSQNLAARDSITLSAGGQLSNSGIIEAGVNADNSRNAGGDVSLAAQTLSNTASVIASRNLALQVSQLTNRGGQLRGQSAAQISASRFDNTQGASLTSTGTLTLDLNNGQLTNSGLINAPAMVLNHLGVVLNSQGEISSSQGFTLAAQSLDNSHGRVISDQSLTLHVAQHLDNSNGLVSAKTYLSATAGSTLNQNGQLLASGALDWSGASLDNRQNGLVAASNGLTFNLDSLDNRGGELSSNTDLALQSHALNNSDSGLIVATQGLSLNVDQLTNQNGGQLTGKGSLALIGQSLDNTGGTLSSLHDLQVALSGSLQNSQGLLSSEGTLGVSAATLANHQGSLSSAGALHLDTLGTLDNQGGQVVTDAGLDLHSQSLDNSNAGALSATRAMTVTTGDFNNSQQGNLSGGDTLRLTAGAVNNANGQIASQHTLTASITRLAQPGGQLFSHTALTLDLNHGQLDNRNGLLNAPQLVLNNLAGVDNSGGEISSAQGFTFSADSLSNDNGKLLSNQALNLVVSHAISNLNGTIAAAALQVQAGSLANTGGTLNSQGDLALSVAGQLTNNGQGLINASGNLVVAASGIDNSNGGNLLGSGIALDLGAATGDLNNSNGLISTQGQLTLNHLRDLDNQHGVLSSTQSLNLVARDIDNSAGQLVSDNLLTLAATRLVNPAGLVSGWQGVTISASSLDNHGSGTVSSRYGDVTVSVDGDLLNGSNGALVSQGALTVTANDLDNSAGILSSGTGQTLTVANLLNNGQGGLIDSGANLTLHALDLSNVAGTLTAQQAFNFTGATLDNTGGSLAANGTGSLNLLGVLGNSHGKLVTGADLLIQGATQVNNQNGQLASQGLLTLLTGGLDNSQGGTLAASGQLAITASGALQNNANGLIYSQNAGLQVQAASLANSRGTLQSQGALALTSTGDIDNQSGTVLAQAGALNISAVNLDSRGGTLSSLTANFDAQLSGVLKNGYDLSNNSHKGNIQAQSLNLTSTALDNDGGRIAAQTGDAVIHTGDINNQNGGLYAGGKVKVTARNLDNSGAADGQIGGQQVDLSLSGALNNENGVVESQSTLSVAAASVDNQTGKLRALGGSGQTLFNIGGLLDNRNGTLETANRDLTLNLGSFQNGNGNLLHVGTGTFAIATANLGNAGGSVVSNGSLTLSADSWTNSSVIQAGQLTVNVGTLNQTASGQLLGSRTLSGNGANWNNDGLIASDGSLGVNLLGSYGGNGRLTSAGDLGLSAAQVTLGTATRIAGGGNTTLNVSGQVSNAGRLTSAAGLTLNASGVDNQGTLGSGLGLVLTTGALSNNQGLIFSGADMSLRVASLDNSYASIYSLGNLSIDRNGQGALADSIVNSSATLQSDGSMSLAASTIQNVRAVLTVDNQGTYTANIVEQPCNGAYEGDCSGSNRNGLFEVTQRSKLAVTAASAASSITAGGNLNLTGGDFLNSSSTVAASGNLTAQLNSLTNQGVVTSDSEDSRTYVTARHALGGVEQTAYAFDQQYWYLNSGYDPNNLSGLAAALAHFIAITESEVTSLHTVTQLSGGDQSYAAVIQAGGAVNISTQNNFNSSAVQAGFNYIGAGARTDTTAPGTAYATHVTLNAQLPPDLAQKQIDPLTLPGFSLPTGQNGLFRLSGQSVATGTTAPGWTLASGQLSGAALLQNVPNAQASAPAVGSATPTSGQSVARVQGLPDSSSQSQPQKYLVETNPALTNLKQFMSSDYLLSALGYNPDASEKRLGDGLYEQTLINQAVVARTGARYIDGQTSDAAQFKYLMDNGIAAQQQLNLTVGTALTAEQVAALTHDIVWMQSEVVDGQTVLVPVLYMASADNRVAANGALVQGSDVSVIAGGDLTNAGTLKATGSLAAAAGNNLVNSGLVQASSRLDLLANNDLTNQAGGIIAGRDVSLTAVNGDVSNVRSVTTHQSAEGTATQTTTFLDSAARVEAANSLTLNAGRDVNNTGGVLSSGAGTHITAGRDVNIAAVQAVNSATRTADHTSSSVTQNAATVTSGGDLSINAGRDLTATASQLTASGNVALSAADNLTLSSAADETHGYSKTHKVTAQEDHVAQVSTTVTAGGSAALSAGQDLDVIASKVNAKDEAYLYAGDAVNLLAAQDSDSSYFSKTKKGSWGKKSSTMSERDSSTSVSSTLNSSTKLVVSAGQDLTAIGAKLTSDGALALSAGGDIVLAAAQDSASQASAKSSKSMLSGKSSTASQSQTTVNASELHAQSVDVQAGRDVVLNAASVYADQGATLRAGRDVSIGSVEVQETASQASSKSKFGIGWYGMPSLAQSAGKGQQVSTQSIGSSLSADTLKISSGRDTAIRGSTLVAEHDLSIGAGGDLSVVSTENSYSALNNSSSKKSGDIGSWWQPAIGIVSAKDTQASASTQQSGSQIASLAGNVDLAAGGHYGQVASQVIAPSGDITVKAQQVDIQAGFDQSSASQSSSSSKTAVGGSVSIPLLDAARNVQQAVQSGSQTSDPRMQALAAANAAMSAQRAYDAAQSLLSKNAGIKVSVSLGTSSRKSESSQSGSNVVGSSVAASGDVSISATGAGKDSTLNIIGSRIDAGHDTNLNADGTINLVAAQNTAQFNSTNSSSGASVGLGFNLGSQNGITLDLAASEGRGTANGSDITQTNTQINAGNTVNLNSGGDTSLAGAVVTANQVQAEVGGDLTITSLRDSSNYNAKQQSAGVGASLCVPPFCGGASSVSGSLSQQKMNSNYDSVSEQSGIKAGDGGFQIHVNGNTGLVGGVIASSTQAVIDGNNSLSTGTLTSVDIRNRADYNASSIALSGGAGASLGRDGDNRISAGAPGAKPASVDNLSANAPVALVASGDESSTTRSGISSGAITIRDNDKQQSITGQTSAQAVAAVNTDVSTDRDGSNKLKTIFNAQEIQAGFDITKTFVQNVGEYLESRAKDVDAAKADAQQALLASQDPTRSDADREASHEQYMALNQQAKDISNEWGAGGTYRQIATALVAGVSGNVSGGATEFAQDMVVNYVQQQGASYIGNLVLKGDIDEGDPIHAALHAILGCAGAAASNQACSAGALGGAASSLLTHLFKDTDPNETQASREAKRDIITSLVTGIAAVVDPSGAAAASSAATANVDNNWLATQQLVQEEKELAAASNPVEQLKVAAKWSVISARQDVLTGVGALSGFTTSLASAGVGAMDGAVNFMSDPVGSMKVMGAFVTSTEGIKIFGANTAALLGTQIDQMTTALTVGGDANAQQLGEQMGSTLGLVISMIATSGEGAAAEALSLSKIGVDVSSSSVSKIAEGVKASDVEAKLAKVAQSSVYNGDLPVITPVKPAPLPAGYTEVAGGGANVSVPVDLPEGWRMVLNTKNGSYEVLAADGDVYVVGDGVLKPKAGGNLEQLAAAEAAIAGAKEIVSFDTKAALTQQIADLRATLTGSAKTSGNLGVAQIDIPGIQPTMVASSRISVTTADQQALGFVGEVPETFPSMVVPTGSNPPQMLNRVVDSEAKILNNIAAQLGDNTSVMGNINLLTERPPCASCSNVIDQFKAKYPNITVNVFDNGGVIRPTKKGP